jgi:hypothetical protein
MCSDYMADPCLTGFPAQGFFTRVRQHLSSIGKSKKDKTFALHDRRRGCRNSENECCACEEQLKTFCDSLRYDTAVHWSWEPALDLQIWSPDLYDTRSRVIVVTRIVNAEDVENACTHTRQQWLSFDFNIQVSTEMTS